MNQKILEKAIQKAIDGGWNRASNTSNVEYKNSMGVVVFSYIGSNVVDAYDPYRIIFNHDFAKALWGVEWHYEQVCPSCKGKYSFWDGDDGYGLPAKFCGQDGKKLKKVKHIEYNIWQYHLQQMVIAEDPIKYLGGNI